MAYVNDPDECIVCHACVSSCPNGAIVSYPDRVEFDVDGRCIECGQCVSSCPVWCIYDNSI